MLSAPSPTSIHYMTLFSHPSYLLHDLSHAPVPDCPHYPISAFFALFMAVPLLPTPSPTFIHYMTLFSHPSYLLHDLSHAPVPACPHYPHFRFFYIIYGSPLATNTFPHLYILYAIVFPSFLPSARPIPFPYPCLAPAPPFRFFASFMAVPPLPTPFTTLLHYVTLFSHFPYPG